MSVKFDAHGIRFMCDLGKGWFQMKPTALMVNPRFAVKLSAICQDLAAAGFVEIGTLGIICDRTVRGGKSTSKHSEGTKQSGYKKWPDGSHGSLACDLVYADTGVGRRFDTAETFDRMLIIAYLRNHGLKCLHTGEAGDKYVNHVHFEVKS